MLISVKEDLKWNQPMWKTLSRQIFGIHNGQIYCYLYTYIWTEGYKVILKQDWFFNFFIFFTVLSLRHGYFLQSKYHSGRKLKISINISKSWVYIMGRFKFVRVNSNNWCDLWTGSKWKPLLLSYDSIEYNNSMNLTRYLTSFLLKKFIE